jgi:hypothetical protein
MLSRLPVRCYHTSLLDASLLDASLLDAFVLDVVTPPYLLVTGAIWGSVSCVWAGTEPEIG